MSAPAEKKSPLQIFGLLFAVGAGVMLLLTLSSEGLKTMFVNIGYGFGVFRQYRMEFLMFLFSMLFLVAIAMLVFNSKKGGGGDH